MWNVRASVSLRLKTFFSLKGVISKRESNKQRQKQKPDREAVTEETEDQNSSATNLWALKSINLDFLTDKKEETR